MRSGVQRSERPDRRRGAENGSRAARRVCALRARNLLPTPQALFRASARGPPRAGAGLCGAVPRRTAVGAAAAPRARARVHHPCGAPPATRSAAPPRAPARPPAIRRRTAPRRRRARARERRRRRRNTHTARSHTPRGAEPSTGIAPTQVVNSTKKVTTTEHHKKNTTRRCPP